MVPEYLPKPRPMRYRLGKKRFMVLSQRTTNGLSIVYPMADVKAYDRKSSRHNRG
jgi:hypothetical protein